MGWRSVRCESAPGPETPTGMGMVMSGPHRETTTDVGAHLGRAAAQSRHHLLEGLLAARDGRGALTGRGCGGVLLLRAAGHHPGALVPVAVALLGRVHVGR